MNVILIGAGRGRRLAPLTDSMHKSFAPVAGRRVLDWTLEAFRSNGLDRFVFIGGYLMGSVRSSYPGFEFVENRGWRNNNILFSLLHARDYFSDGFYATYTDTLFRPSAVAALKASPHDITLVMDTEWRDRYRYRTMHPESDAEKMVAANGRVQRISRAIAPAEATGEFTGVMRMTALGAQQFGDCFDALRADLGPDGLFAEGKPFRMAYLIHQLDRMITDGIGVHCVPVPGDYHEIDTLEDYGLATGDWVRFASAGGPST